MDWAVPQRSLAAIQAEAHARHQAGDRQAVAALAREAALAFPLEGTNAPLHGIWVMALAALGAGATVAGVSLGREADRRSLAEGTLRGAGVTLGIACLVVLVDYGSDVFRVRAHGVGLWLTGLLLLAGCLAATFASTRLPAPEEAP